MAALRCATTQHYQTVYSVKSHSHALATFQNISKGGK